MREHSRMSPLSSRGPSPVNVRPVNGPVRDIPQERETLLQKLLSRREVREFVHAS